MSRRMCWSGVGVTSSCRLPNMYAGNQSRVLSKSRKCSQPPSYLSRLVWCVLNIFLPSDTIHSTFTMYSSCFNIRINHFSKMSHFRYFQYKLIGECCCGDVQQFPQSKVLFSMIQLPSLKISHRKSRSKQFMSFKLFDLLNSVVKTCSITCHPTGM